MSPTHLLPARIITNDPSLPTPSAPDTGVEPTGRPQKNDRRSPRAAFQKVLLLLLVVAVIYTIFMFIAWRKVTPMLEARHAGKQASELSGGKS